MKRSTLFFLTFLFYAAASHATNRFELNFHAGLMNPIASDGVSGAANPNVSNADVESAGPTLGGSMFYWFGKKWALGFEGGYTPNVEIKETYDHKTSGLFGTVQLEGTSTEPMTHLLRKSPRNDGKKPSGYFFLGAGFYSRPEDGSMTFEGGKTVGFSTTRIRQTGVLGYSIDSFGFAPGFGLSIPLGTAASLGFDLRFHILSQDGIRFVNPMLQLSF